LSEGEGLCAMERLTCGAPHGTAFARCVEEAVGGLMLVSARPVPFTRILRLDFSSQSPAAEAAGTATLAEQDIVDDGGIHTHREKENTHIHTHTHTHSYTHTTHTHTHTLSLSLSLSRMHTAAFENVEQDSVVDSGAVFDYATRQTPTATYANNGGGRRQMRADKLAKEQESVGDGGAPFDYATSLGPQLTSGYDDVQREREGERERAARARTHTHTHAHKHTHYSLRASELAAPVLTSLFYNDFCTANIPRR